MSKIKYAAFASAAAAALIGLVFVAMKTDWLPAGNKLGGQSTAQDERLSLHLFINGPAGAVLPDRKNDFVRQAIESKFHVDLKVTAMEPGNEYNSRLASLLAANDPPDVWLGISPDGGASYALDNALADMTLFVSPATMPNYFKYWMNETELKQYQFHNKFFRAPIPYDKNSYRAYYIRQDWLDRLGLPIPSTYDEYYRVLEAFTNEDPDGNGKNDTYGFTTSGGGTAISADWPEYVKNGLLFPAFYDGSRLVDMQMDLRVGSVADDILKVMDKGLVEPDWFLNKGLDYVDKAVRGKAGIVLGNTVDFAFDSNANSIQARSKAIDPKAEWVPFNPFGNQPLRAAVTPEYPFVFSNNAAGLNPEKLKRIAAILDWLCGEEGFLLTHYGVEGKHYSRNGSEITLKPQVIEEDIVNKGNFLAIWSFFTPNTPQTLGLNVIDPRMTERDKTIYRTITGIPVYESVGTTLTPPLGVSAEAMRAKQNELQVQMLFKDKSGQNWPAYRKDILDNYKGNEIFNQYEVKIKAAKEGR
ncbi:extracellular solute-binding protein [Paenibacillus contaminans]|uniref:ABC transporter substrate-binding protein n=1 Tax=Paenibacillus contaminans TaxID=450362 RepID=A0A329MMR0_9BACL|nr:extracellular solute-binding protein [Paenibacillus contaminans]RAV21231.1 hypothetical protein DQG23_11250 [Paenibacillus contaminans]